MIRNSMTLDVTNAYITVHDTEEANDIILTMEIKSNDTMSLWMSKKELNRLALFIEQFLGTGFASDGE